MNDAQIGDYALNAIVDHELGDDELQSALDRLAADEDAAARCAAYSAQRDSLAALRDGLSLHLPTPGLAEAQEELQLVAHRHDQLKLAAAIGGVMALVAVIGLTHWPDSTRQTFS